MYPPLCDNAILLKNKAIVQDEKADNDAGHAGFSQKYSQPVHIWMRAAVDAAAIIC
jgi:hypothetical protein